MASPQSAGSPLSRNKFGEALVREGYLTVDQFRQALQEQKHQDQPLGLLLVEKGVITEHIRINAMRTVFGYDLLDLTKIRVDPVVATLIPHSQAAKHRIFPLRREGKDRLLLAMEDPSDEATIETLKLQLGMEIRPYIITVKDLDTLLHTNAAQKQTPQGPLAGKLPRKYNKRAHAWTFRAFVFLPFIILMALIWANESFQRFLLESEQSFFDLGIYIGLGFGLWAVAMYEVTGILFKSEQEED